MNRFIATLLRYRALMLLILAAWIAAGVYAFRKLDIEAYPDPSPPLVEVITQNPSWSAEEMEQQVTVPLETALNGMPHLQYVRSISIFGLSDIKMYFGFDSDYFRDRQEVLNRLQGVNLPANLSPQLSPWSPVGEIYRFWLDGPGYSLNELKATADWLVRREVKQVPGIVDLTVFGGTTRQYQAEVDPRRLLQYNVTLPQVVQAVQNANANAGGNYLSLGQQNVNVRGIGLLKEPDEMGSVVITSRNSAPVLLRDVAQVHEGNQPRLGQIGVDNRNDIVEGITLLQRGEESLPALAQLHQKIKELNTRLLPPGMKIRTLYDRADLIHVTTSTVRHVIILGLVLVTLLLLVFLGDVRMSLITALTIPLSVIFAFGMMVLTGHSANLISIGAIDFGILVDASVIVLEHVFRSLQARREEESVFDVVARAAGESARPVLFSTLIIVVAFIPLFTMEGVPGRIFAPMSMTYGFALAGALLFALLIAPVLATWGANDARERKSEVRLVAWLEKHYSRKLEWVMANRRKALIAAFAALAVALICLPFIGGEFMPKLEEGNLWVRATLPPDVSFDYASALANRIRQDLRGFPETTQVISQIGRPDDGTDATAFNDLEFSVSLKPPDQWPGHISKRELIHQMNQALSKYPGVDFNFSQNIQDNVEEAMSGVKGENSLKLFGDDIDTLTSKAGEMEQVMSRVPGVADLGVFDVKGQPNLLISIDRAAAARYGLTSSDLNAAVQAAIGGLAATQVLDGDRHFDFVVRYQAEFRQEPDAIRNILLPTPDGERVPLGQVASVIFNNGAFMIYRENDRRYIPIKFSVRGRDLSTTMQDIQQRLDREIHLPTGYHFEWAGEYDNLVKEEHRLLVVIPLSLAIILSLLYMNFNSWSDAAIILAMLPFGAIGGVLGLLVTRTPFSISAAVGFASALGVGTLGGLVFLNAVRRAQRAGEPLYLAIRSGAAEEVRPVIMACLAAGLGLLPAAVSSGIGVQAQQPLARVVVGAMVTTIAAVLFLLPVLASFGHSVMQEGAECAPEPQEVAG